MRCGLPNELGRAKRGSASPLNAGLLGYSMRYGGWVEFGASAPCRI